ncbi:MAG TPA: MATE family efflux transporter [Sedimentisphaerales bacterium]|nr:MATE family efflux transporter [Sedimentisphaerales bacterium]HRS12301.1 MATE family efflux transporter [Sedimentisphaerales bacterium]HRV48972.1 MATE family efflux transporter [Sedimentisphaerales bacterium]
MSVLVQRSVKRTLFGMAFPMLAGTFAMNAYNLTDTWFVSRLGTLPLAAMGFTFPVVMLLSCVAGGLGVGTTTLMSHAVGRHNWSDAARITTHGLMLTLGVAAGMAVIGYLSMNPVFRALGADSVALPLVRQYMGIWYLGAPLMALPMLGNGLLISAGDSVAAGRFMMAGPILNVVLDPIMMFGYLGFPAMGIRGAALATVIAQGVSTLWLFRLLYAKHRLLLLQSWGLAAYCTSFGSILRLGVPSILSMILMPVSATVVTRILSGFGNAAVAAIGAAQRIEMFAFVIPMALGMSLAPFVSQNLGAERPDRIRRALSLSARFAMMYGGGVALVFFVGAPWLASIFSRDAEVVVTLVAYVRIVSFGYGMMEIHRYSGIILTGLHKPLSSALLNGIRVLVLLIPLSWLGARLAGVHGVFVGRLLTDLLAGFLGFFWVRRACHNVSAS